MKYLMLALLLTSVCLHSQSHVKSVPYHPKMAKGKIDSAYFQIKYFKNQFQHIEPISQFHTILDTIADNSGVETGLCTVNVFGEINEGQRVGLWKAFYPNGKLKAEGLYALGAVTYCMTVGPHIAYYGYKSGKWTFYHENGQKRAEGIYTQVPEEFETSCGGDAYFNSNIDENWKFWDESGKAVRMDADIENELNDF